MKLMDRCRQKLPPLKVVRQWRRRPQMLRSSLAFSIIGYIQPFKVQGQNRGKEDENTSCFPPTLPSLLPLLLIIDNHTRTSIPAFLAVLSFWVSLISRFLIGSFFDRGAWYPAHGQRFGRPDASVPLFQSCSFEAPALCGYGKELWSIGSFARALTYHKMNKSKSESSIRKVKKWKVFVSMSTSKHVLVIVFFNV